jgi:uncharacterized protein (DUF433 family)
VISIVATKPKPFSPKDPRVANPVFAVPEAAMHLGVPYSTLRNWLGHSGHGTFVTVLPADGHGARVPFLGFAEAFVLTAFRRAGVPMQRIRPAVVALQKEIGLEHALASRNLYTDGAEVLFDFAEKNGDEELLELTVLRTGQKQFSEIVRDYLKRVTYADDGWVSRLELPAYEQTRVVVDPKQAFGQPLVVEGGARVEDLVHRFRAGDTLADISDDFGVPRADVEEVVRVALRAAHV